MEHETVKMCSKCHTVKPLVKHRTICTGCNLERKRAVAAAKLATPEGTAANRARAAAFRATPEGREYARNFVKQPKQRERVNASKRKRYVPNPRKVMTDDEWKVHLKVYRARNRRENYAAHLHREIRTRAERRGLPFDLEVSYFENALTIGTCEISGMAFQESEKRGPFSMSIDKIKPELGYVTGNVRAVLWCINAAMGDWGLNVLLPAIHAIVDRNPATDV